MGLRAAAGAAQVGLVTTAAVVGFVAALVVAAADWWSVRRQRKSIEYLCKPGTMALLVLSALVLHPHSGTERAWFVVALGLGLVGDVFLMLPRDRFVPGLLSFLLGHLAFVAGFVSGGLSAARAVGGIVVVVGLGAFLLPPVLRGARSRREPGLVPAVVAYVVVISLMVVAAFASRQPLAALPAALFFGSDTLIAYRRFVAPRDWMPLAIIVTYHLAQAGFVLWLVS